MSKLPKFTLSYDDRKDDWKLARDKSHETIKRFDTKEVATKGGVLEKALGKNGGSVKIEYKEKSGYEEERTFPRSADPKSSKG